MQYGGPRRRPGPLLGGSAILTKRNNQQRIQYLQQIQNIVHQKEEQQEDNKLEIPNTNSTTHILDIANHNFCSGNPNLPKSNLNYAEKSDKFIPSHYPDLLSHELPHSTEQSYKNHQSLISEQVRKKRTSSAISSSTAIDGNISNHTRHADSSHSEVNQNKSSISHSYDSYNDSSFLVNQIQHQSKSSPLNDYVQPSLVNEIATEQYHHSAIASPLPAMSNFNADGRISSKMLKRSSSTVCDIQYMRRGKTKYIIIYAASN